MARSNFHQLWDAAFYKKTAHINYQDDKAIIASPYNPDFVLELKSRLKFRRWNKDNKCWIVDIKERQKLMEIASRFYQVVEDNQPSDNNISDSSSNVEPIEDTSGIDIASVLRPAMKIEIWTDGASVHNPGPGGYGILFEYQGQKWERTGGFRRTTNNRMEIMGALLALETLPEKCKVVIYTDSQYVVNSIMKGWAKRWRSKGWKRKDNKRVPNADLWERMLQMCDKHKVEFKWVKGHNLNVNNNRCDRLAHSAARKPNCLSTKVIKALKVKK